MVDFDSMLNTHNVLPRTELVEGPLSTVHWDTEGGGITIHQEVAALLEDKWQQWLDQSAFESGSALDEGTELNVSADEGFIKVVIHKARERDSSIVRAKKLAAWHTLRRLACEVCDFDFAKYYGQHGEKYIECHHRMPLRDVTDQKGQRTRLEDLALVCSNCHRMLHRGVWPSIDKLRSLIAERGSALTVNP